MTKLVIILLLGIVGLATTAKLPGKWKVCKRSDPNLDKCLKPAIQQAVQDLIPGSQPLGVPSMDPFIFKNLKINQGSGPVSLDLEFTDLVLTGAKTTVIEDVKADWNKGKLEIDFHFKAPAELKGQYKSEGKVLVLPLKGDGGCTLKFEDYKGHLILNGSQKKSDGKTHLHFDKGQLHFTTSKFTMFFENLLSQSSNKELGGNVNKFLNDNWEAILNELMPPISEALGEALRQVANRLFDRVPLEAIAPE